MIFRKLKTIFATLSLALVVFSFINCPSLASPQTDSNSTISSVESATIQANDTTDECATSSAQHLAHCLTHCSHIGLSLLSGASPKIDDPGTSIPLRDLSFNSHSSRPDIEPPIKA